MRCGPSVRTAVMVSAMSRSEVDPLARTATHLKGFCPDRQRTVGSGGEDNHGNRMEADIGAKHFDEISAVHFGDIQVEQDEIRRALDDIGHRGAAVGGAVNRVTLTA